MKCKHGSYKELGVHIKPILWKLIKADKLLPEDMNLIYSTN